MQGVKGDCEASLENLLKNQVFERFIMSLLGRQRTGSLFDRLCFNFVDSESTLGLTLSCATVQLCRTLVLNGEANLHITSFNRQCACDLEPFVGGFLEAHN